MCWPPLFNTLLQEVPLFIDKQAGWKDGNNRLKRTCGVARIVGCWTVLAAVAPLASGLSFTLNGLSAGTTIPGVGTIATNAPASAVGSGNLDAIMQAAAAYWSASIFDNATLTINYGWSNIGSAATTVNVNQGMNGGVYRNISVGIAFASGASAPVWYIDASPLDNLEYPTFFQLTDLLSTSLSINTGRVYSGAVGNAANYDLLSAAIHEIGHGLGLDSFYSGYTTRVSPQSTLIVTSGISSLYQGAAIPVLGASNAHINGSLNNLGSSVLQSTLASGSRYVPSTADIFAVCQSSQFTQCTAGQANLDSIPEPQTTLLVASGLGWLFWRRRVRNGRNSGA